MKDWHTKHIWHYIIQINDMTVFSKDDVELALGLFIEASVYDKNLAITLTFSPDKQSKDMIRVPKTQVDQLRHVVQTMYEMYHGIPFLSEEDLSDEEILCDLEHGNRQAGKGSQSTRL